MTKTFIRKAPVAECAMTYAVVFPSKLGWFALGCSDRAVTQLNFAVSSDEVAMEKLGKSLAIKKISKKSQLEQFPAWIAELVLDLQSYADGERVSFNEVPVEHTNRTKFQQRVISECRKIAPGTVKSYGELARLAGSAGAARAVGSVMASNRVPIIIPCHRVVGSKGLGGFSATGGLTTKRKLLEMEASGC